MKEKECWHPETENPYPLCVGEMLNGEIKDEIVVIEQEADTSKVAVVHKI